MQKDTIYYIWTYICSNSTNIDEIVNPSFRIKAIAYRRGAAGGMAMTSERITEDFNYT